LANTLVWIFLSRSGVVNVSDTLLPYPVYVFTGTMLWAILMDALNAPLQIVTASKIMLAKINFPREALVVAGIYHAIVNALIKVALLLIALLAMGVHPGWNVVVSIGAANPGRTFIGWRYASRTLYADVGTSPLMHFLMYITPVVFRCPRRLACHVVPAESANPADPYRA
jgi:lipopolysaccharide transport system permease protein